MKRCPSCGETRELSEFAVDKSRRDGHNSTCKQCDNARSHAYYEAHREQVIARVTARRGRPDGWRGRRASGRRRTRYS